MSRNRARKETVVLAIGKPSDERKVTTNGRDFKIEETIETTTKETTMENQTIPQNIVNNIATEVMTKKEQLEEASLFLERMKTTVGEKMEQAKENIASIGEKIKGFFSGFFGKVKTAWKSFIEYCKTEKVKTVVTSVVSIIIGVVSGIFLPATGVGAVFAGIGISLLTFLASIITQIVIKSKVQNAMDDLEIILSKISVAA